MRYSDSEHLKVLQLLNKAIQIIDTKSKAMPRLFDDRYATLEKGIRIEAVGCGSSRPEILVWQDQILVLRCRMLDAKNIAETPEVWRRGHWESVLEEYDCWPRVTRKVFPGKHRDPLASEF